MHIENFSYDESEDFTSCTIMDGPNHLSIKVKIDGNGNVELTDCVLQECGDEAHLHIDEMRKIVATHKSRMPLWAKAAYKE